MKGDGYQEQCFNNENDKGQSDLRYHLKVELTGVLARLDVYERQREESRLTSKYLTRGNGTREFPYIGTGKVKEKQV